MKPGSSLNRALIRNYILIGVLPVLIIGVACLLIFSRTLTKEISKKNQILTTSIASEVHVFLKEPLSLMNQMSDLITSTRLISEENISQYLHSIVNNYPFFEMVQYLNKDGKVVSLAPDDASFINIDMSNQLFFSATQSSGKPFWSSTFISMRSGAPTLTLSVPAQEGMLVGYLNLDTLSGMVQRLSSDHHFTVITDNQGTIIGDITPERVRQRINLQHIEAIRTGLSGQAGTYTVTEHGIKMLASVVPVKLTGWLVIFFQHYDLHQDDAFTPVRNVIWVLLFGIIMTVITAVGAAFLVAKGASRPLFELMHDVQRVADGNYSMLTSGQSYLEIMQLRSYFNRMASTIMLREKTLKESERLHRHLIESIPHGIQESSPDGIITFANTSCDRIFECERGESVGKPIWYTAETEKKSKELQAYIQFLIQKRPVPEPYLTTATTYKGNTIEIQVDWQYNHDPDGKFTGFISVITDITENKQLEENLRQSQKMEAVGTLAGGIAHDFNNILSAILGYSEIVLDKLPPESSSYDEQKQIIKASLRAKDLVQHLLLFSRKQNQIKSPVIIADIVNEALKLLRASLPSTIVFELDINPKTGIIDADATQIHQIIINLCTNAAHAMEEKGGSLKVSLQKVTFQEKDLHKPQELQPGDYAYLSVSDSGQGIEEKNLKRIFEPFFTTKSTGKGTGMGLAVVHGIVSSHNGGITVNSSLENGTKFNVFLPLVNFKTVQKPDVQQQYVGKGEQILVVDDEEPITLLISTLLENIGYRTTSITDSSKALAYFLENITKFDMVITDHTMPGLTGYELSREILAARPDIPIILCTGYSPSISKDQVINAGISSFLYKPVSKQTLYRRVASLLSDKNERK